MIYAPAAAMATKRRPASIPGLLPKVARLVARAVLASSIVTAFLVFLCGAFPALLGLRTMVVTSGSMAPHVGAGDAVVIARVSPESIQVHDVITFRNDATQGMVTHRVVAIKEIRGSLYFQTQGDANEAPDPNLAAAQAVYGKAALRLPKAGYLLYFSVTLWGKLLLIGLPLLLLLGQETLGLLRRKRGGEGKPGGPGLGEAGLHEEIVAVSAS